MSRLKKSKHRSKVAEQDEEINPKNRMKMKSRRTR